MTKEQRLAEALKTQLDLPEATDAEILELTKGSLTRAWVEANLAMRDLGETLAHAARGLADTVRRR